MHVIKILLFSKIYSDRCGVYCAFLEELLRMKCYIVLKSSVNVKAL